ncbi:MAG: hypothetical protein P4L55_06050 [Syntrophobacteraceae bacterium]|nr:hypothetical protein [Syntrophobacteraceae bacterium]
MIDQFCNICAALLAQPGLPCEFRYRIGKLIDSVIPIDGKVYLKTLRGKEILRQCIEIANSVEHDLIRNDDLPYRTLTALEITCNDLLNRTYEFRIKAG